MAKVNTTKKIDPAEFPSDVRPWLTKLIVPINGFFEQVYRALVNGLTVKENLKAQKFELEIVADQTWPMKVSWTLNERPTAMLLAQIQESRGEDVPTHSIFWAFDNGTIEITVTGLDDSKAYKATIVGLV